MRRLRRSAARPPWKIVFAGVVAVAVVSGCGGDDDVTAGQESTTSTAEPTTTTQPPAGEPGPALAQTCEAARYRVRFPEGWATNSGELVPACRYFHPEPFEVPTATEFIDVAAIFDVEPVRFDELADRIGQPGTEVLEQEMITAAGRPGLRVDARATGDALLPAGTHFLQYLVELDSSTLVASTYDLPSLNHDDNRAVLDAMIDTLEVKPEAECSAAGLPAEPSSQDVPPAVAGMREEIVGAATACDYSRLASLATQGEFTYSFGGGDDPAGYWRQQEQDEDPLQILVELLNRPSGTRPGPDEGDLYVWPRAYAYDRWEDVPAEAREELQPIYGPEDFEDFSRFGSYAGYRVGITADGDWLFFVAGD